MLADLLTAFTLGNGAILTNVCLLPLYPGLLAFLGGQAQAGRAGAVRWLGLLVLAGVLTMMLVIGLVLVLLNAAFGPVLTVLLPLLYAVVIVLGLLMLAGRNPFVAVQTVHAPVLQNPYATAFVYGLLLGPMTLPCTGPLVTSIFALGLGSATNLFGGLSYFLAFGLGFGWPLVLLPLVAGAAQKRFLGWMHAHHTLITRVAGVLLVAIGVFGLVTEWLPNIIV